MNLEFISQLALAESLQIFPRLVSFFKLSGRD